MPPPGRWQCGRGAKHAGPGGPGASGAASLDPTAAAGISPQPRAVTPPCPPSAEPGAQRSPRLGPEQRRPPRGDGGASRGTWCLSARTRLLILGRSRFADAGSAGRCVSVCVCVYICVRAYPRARSVAPSSGELRTVWPGPERGRSCLFAQSSTTPPQAGVSRDKTKRDPSADKKGVQRAAPQPLASQVGQWKVTAGSWSGRIRPGPVSTCCSRRCLPLCGVRRAAAEEPPVPPPPYRGGRAPGLSCPSAGSAPGAAGVARGAELYPDRAQLAAPHPDTHISGEGTS